MRATAEVPGEHDDGIWRKIVRVQQSGPNIRRLDILAMGNAALEACRAVSERRDSIPAGGVAGARTSNGHGASLVLQGQPIPLEATFLPVDENMRKPARAELIKQDLAAFLGRRDWRAGDTWPTSVSGEARE